MAKHSISSFAALAGVCLLTACGPDSSGGYGGLGQDPTDLPEGVATETWSIGDRWYDYEFQGSQAHTVYPSEKAFMIVRPEGGAILFSVTNYYDEFGNSARPTTAFRVWDGSKWTASKRWTPEKRIFSDIGCMSFETFDTVDCATEDYDFIWRSNHRPVPEMQFAVGNPGIYITPREGLQVWELPAYVVTTNSRNDVLPESPEAALVSEGAIRRISALEGMPRPALPVDRLNEGTAIYQLSADLRFLEYTIVQKSAEEPHTAVIRSRCVTAGQQHALTPLFDMEPTEVEVSLGEKWTFVDVCGETVRDCEEGETPQVADTCVDRAPEITQVQSELLMGQWPENRTFDLVFEMTDDGYRVFATPDTPFTVNPGTPFATAPTPLLLWSDPDFVMPI